jgi:hypothetical protein
MRSERRGELHRHAAGGALRAESNVSLLRLSVPARLIMVAMVSALLWMAVLWALR